MIMKTLDGNFFDMDTFEGVYKYIHRLLNKGFEIKTLHVHPTFYKTILKSELWYEIRRAKDNTKFRYFENAQGIIIELIVNSAMDGNFCVITELKTKVIK